MVTERLAEVRDAASRFRRAFESSNDLHTITFDDFPHGACGDAAVLVGQYLEDCGLGIWMYWSGVAPAPKCSHGWVEQDGLIVDITADQYPDVEEAVIVTTDRSWHSHFDPAPDHPANFGGFVGGASTLPSDYRILRERADGTGAVGTQPA